MLVDCRRSPAPFHRISLNSKISQLYRGNSHLCQLWSCVSRFDHLGFQILSGYNFGSLLSVICIVSALAMGHNTFFCYWSDESRVLLLLSFISIRHQKTVYRPSLLINSIPNKDCRYLCPKRSFVYVAICLDTIMGN